MPFHRMAEDAMKLEPVTVIVVAELPDGMVLGEIDVSVGTGFEGAWIVRVAPDDVPPPGAGVTTVTMAVPADVMSAAGTWATKVDAFTKAVESATAFHMTTEVD